MRNRFFLFILLIFTSFSLFPQDFSSSGGIDFSLKEGTYKENKTLFIYSAQEVYYSFKDFPQRKIRYVYPLEFSAVHGEERSYELSFFTYNPESDRYIPVEGYDEYSVTIDKKVPLPPRSSLLPGSYFSGLEFTFTAGENFIIYSIDKSLDDYGTVWDGSAIILTGKKGSVKTYNIYAYSQDRGGNISDVAVFSYTVDLTDEGRETVLDIVSPVSGTFANPQHLYISGKNLEWIKYTTDGSDPKINGIEYTGPVLIENEGDVTVKIAGKSLIDDFVVSESVEYSVESDSLFGDPLKGGTFDTSVLIDLSSAGKEAYYTFDDTTPGEDDTKFNGPFYLDLVKGGMRSVILRYRGKERSGWLAERRYFFILDDRYPAAPEISAFYKDGKYTVTIDSYDDENVYYTLADTTPTEASSFYSGPFTYTLSQGERARVRAVTVLQNGRRSMVVEQDLVDISELIPQPEIIIDQGGDNRAVTLGIGNPGNYTTLFTMAYDEESLVMPDADSPVLTGNTNFDIPHGDKKSFYLALAFVDDKGRVSNPANVNFTIDKQPPGAPVITRKGDDIRITGSGDIYYHITSDGSAADPDGAGARRYSEPISVPGWEDDIVAYSVAAVSVSKSGNKSETAGPYTFIVDKRYPIIKGVSDGAVYNKEEAVIGFSNIGDSHKIYYTLSEDGSEPDDPSQSSFLYDGSIRIRGKEGNETVYSIKYTVYSDGILIDKIRDFSFSLDLKGPQPPIVTGIVDGQQSNTPLFVSAYPAGAEDIVYLLVSTSNGDTIERLLYLDKNRYSEPVVLSGMEDEDITYYIAAGAADAAGNRLGEPLRYTCVIDKRSPLPPAVLGVPEKNISARDEILFFYADEGDIFYEITKDGSLPPIPGGESEKYTDDGVLLSCKYGEERGFNIALRARDKSGNFSKPLILNTIVIDKKNPEAVHPQFTGMSDGSSLLSWPYLSENEVFYRLKSEELVNQPFSKYTRPVKVDFQAGTIEYYIADKAGNKTDLYKEGLPDFRLPDPPVLVGFSDGGVYAESMVVQNRSDGFVRYEIGTSGSPPKEPDGKSPLMGETLELDAVPGEVITYSIRAKTFKDLESEKSSEEVFFTLTLDKKPPREPVLFGVDDNIIYQDDVTIEIERKDVGRVYYKIDSEGRPGSFSLYTQPIQLKAEKGVFNDFTVTAYVEDQAGNRSGTISKTFYIDKAVIFVSTNGDDRYKGSSKYPFRTIEKAIAECIKQGKQTVFLSGGTYLVQSPIVVPGNIQIIGRKDPSTWLTDSPLETIIKTGNFFPFSKPLIMVQDGNCSLEKISFKQVHKQLGTIIYVKKGNLLVDDCDFEMNTRVAASVIRQQGGDVLIQNSNFSGTLHDKSRIIHAEKGNLSIVDSTISGASPDGDVTLISLFDCPRVDIVKSEITCKADKRAVGIEINGTQAVLEDVFIEVEGAGFFGTAIVAGHSGLTITRSVLQGSDGAYNFTGLNLNNVKTTLDNSIIILRAVKGATGIISSYGSFESENCIYTGYETGEFLYFGNFDSTSITFVNNHMINGKTENLVGFSLRNAEMKILHNTFIFGSGSSLLKGVYADTKSRGIIGNNIIYTKNGRPSGTALHIPDASYIDIAANAFSGWQYVLTSTYPSRKINNVDDLNLFDSSPFGGSIRNNVTEHIGDTFLNIVNLPLILKPMSICVNGGDLFDDPEDGEVDSTGNVRPNPDFGVVPLPDIGAVEFY